MAACRTMGTFRRRRTGRAEVLLGGFVDAGGVFGGHQQGVS